VAGRLLASAHTWQTAAERHTDFYRRHRDDWFSIDCTRIGSGMAEVDESTRNVSLFQVVVHVVDGLLHELEIFAGEGVAVQVPLAEELNEITLM
jgi:hypothetical protein